ncbi:caspase family protein [Dyadobacter psychrophilus]|uniref:Caspase domain-containing protein n=1 Tax=Dyadobacter psychrophilus TaxID=651661 RepID=A0A1T5HFZ3_9BACT|nr:caspase family protein [Dyadobacter psychrophilus]SKC19586.1 Caspase domain-containing protein [Dyadobacter psychrophilus]
MAIQRFDQEGYSTPRSDVLVIILGASEFPKSSFESNIAFANAADEISRYFLRKSSFNINPDNLLNRFNDPRSSSSILKDIGNFIRTRVDELREEGTSVTDLIMYYVGHGAFEKNEYYLAIQDTTNSHKAWSSIQAGALNSVFGEYAAWLRIVIILDACFSAGLASQMQGSYFELVKVNLAKKRIATKGISILASSSKDEVSMVTREGNLTMFTKALLLVLKNGSPDVNSSRLTLETIHFLLQLKCEELYESDAIQPQIHSPKQPEGVVAQVELFPNAYYEKEKEFEKLKKDIIIRQDIELATTTRKEEIRKQQLLEATEEELRLKKMFEHQDAIKQKIINEEIKLHNEINEHEDAYRIEAEQVTGRQLNWKLLDMWLQNKQLEKNGAILRKEKEQAGIESYIQVINRNIEIYDRKRSNNEGNYQELSETLFEFYEKRKQNEVQLKEVIYEIAKYKSEYNVYTSIFSGKLRAEFEQHISKNLPTDITFQSIVDNYSQRDYKKLKRGLDRQYFVEKTKSNLIFALYILFLILVVYSCFSVEVNS